MSEYAFRSRRVTTTSDSSARGLRAAVLDERASRHALRRRASEEGSGSRAQTSRAERAKQTDARAAPKKACERR